MAATDRFDAIVIGSGISGGWAAKELTEKGLRVLMVDRGRMVEHGEDYPFDGKSVYETPARDRMPAALAKRDYFALNGWVSPATQPFFINDRLNPYDYDAPNKFNWVRPSVVGGKSLTWGRWSFRWAPTDYEANKREGVGVDWPIRYEDVAPWYSYVEKYIGVSGGKENLDYLPDSEFMPPFPMNVAEKWLKGRLEGEFPGRKLINAHVLLNSRPKDSERSWFHSNGALGSQVMDHIFRVGVQGEIPGMTDLIEYGRRPGGVYVPRFRNLTTEALPFKRGYGYQGQAFRQPAMVDGFGADMKHGMREYGPWRFSMGAFGECLPYDDNRVMLNFNKTDRFGTPLLRFDVTFRDNEIKMMDDALEQGQLMLRRAGLTNVTGGRGKHVPGEAIHEMGGARMGRDPNTSVLNGWNQAHDAANLFVTDGAQMASVSCVNPSLTFMAMTARAADHAVKQMKEGII
ncbi:GMC oxidoreductase [Sphingomonas sp. NPDC079357]|uniref:GMC oxidoreductase n=1 Tax=Sphingomonas sp. NPDC079357 TaxID=3364518 RepID=UPI00384C85BA